MTGRTERRALHAVRAVPTAHNSAPQRGAQPALQAAVDVAMTMCARESVDGSILPATHPGEVALELRDLLPHVADAAFDTHMAQIVAAAAHVSAAESAGGDDSHDDDADAYQDAALEAGLDPGDFATDGCDVDEEGRTTFRSAVIEHWDLELRARVEALVLEEYPADGRPARSGTTGQSA